MKKLSQNTRIIISIIVLALVSVSGIYLTFDEPFDGFASYIVGIGNGFVILEGFNRWEKKEK